MPVQHANYTTDEVKFVQQFLTGTGYYHGAMSGSFDNATYDALVRWQRDKGLGVSGQIDLATTSTMATGIQQITRTQVDPVDQKILDQYGPALYAYRLHPEIGNILRWAAAAGYDEQRLWGLLEKTEWYRTTSDSARKWDDANLTDPSTAQRSREQRHGQVQDQARTMGVYVTEREINDITEDSLRYGWSDAELQDVLSSYIKQSLGAAPGTEADANGRPVDPSGTVQVAADGIKAQAKQFMISVDDQEAQDLAARVSRGELTQEGVTSLFRSRAIARFGGTDSPLADIINQGTSPADYFSEHQSRIAQRLGLPKDAVNFDEPRWGKILDFVDDKGKHRPMTVPEALAYISDDKLFPEYDKAPQTTAQAASLALDIQQKFTGVR